MKVLLDMRRCDILPLGNIVRSGMRYCTAMHINIPMSSGKSKHRERWPTIPRAAFTSAAYCMILGLFSLLHDARGQIVINGNEFVNGNFESGSFDGWNLATYGYGREPVLVSSSIDRPANAGKFSAFLSQSQGFSNYYATGTLGQHFVINSNHRILFDAQWSVSSSAYGQAHVWATVLDVAKGISVFSMTLSSLSYNQNSGGWQSLSTDALPAGLYRLEFGASAADLGGGVGDASLYVDNVRLEPVVIPGDLNSDDSVDAMDAGIMFANWTGDPSLSGHGPMTLPEPSTAMLLSMLWPCIAMRRR